jgi:hypothetical protein
LLGWDLRQLPEWTCVRQFPPWTCLSGSSKEGSKQARSLPAESRGGLGWYINLPEPTAPPGYHGKRPKLVEFDGFLTMVNILS